MKHIPHIEIKEYQYELPEKSIAKYPLPERDASKLLIYKNGLIETSQYKFLPRFLPENTTLVFNNTKVVEARLQFLKPTGGQIEVFCLEPYDDNEDIIMAMQTTGKVNWKCLIGGAKKWKSGNLEKNINTPNGTVLLQANKKEQISETGVFVIEFSWNNETLSFAEILHYAGIIPLPPYLNRETEKEDAVRYQTVYAEKDGSVAAPTAGMHFTTQLMNELQGNGIKEAYITLHVGAGTFKPVKANEIANHEMHAEFIDVQKNTIRHLLQQLNAPIIAVGTTSLRTLESLYWIGVKIHEWFQIHQNYNVLTDFNVEQWAPYHSNNKSITSSEALQAILNWMDAKGTERLITKTSIIIVPGYTFKIIKGLITNFHQPQSTLLLLIAAIIGTEWKKLYQFALNNNFRFLSYGDGSLLWL